MTNPLRPGDPARIGPYSLHARLGGGGMGQVFLGRSPGGHTVAVKVVHPDVAENPAFRRRFAVEVEAARKVGGFYTAQVVDADPDANPPWLATAYIPGPTLYEAVEGHGPLPRASVAALGAGLAEGLAAIHTCGIVHRDLKPGNVLLAADGPRVIDFGIARALDTTSATRTRTVMGTAGFMSPEQVRGGRIGPPGDVFTLGCVLGYAATGHSPFGEGPIEALGYRIVHEDPALDGIPAGLSPTIRACLAKDPADRPGLEEVLADLTAPAAAAGGDPGRPWLPEALTGIITHRTAALTLADTRREPPTARAARPKRKRRPDTGPDRTGPKEKRRSAPEPDGDAAGTELVVGNLSAEPLDVIVDGVAMGGVRAGGTRAFSPAPGRRSLLVEVPGRRGVVRSINVKADAAVKMAFDIPERRQAVPEPVREVVFTGSRLPTAGGMALLWILLIWGLGGLAAVGATAAGDVHPSVDVTEMLLVIAGLGLAAGAIVGVIGLFVPPSQLTLTHRRLKAGLPNGPKSLSWDRIGQVSVVGNGRTAMLVLWPSEGTSFGKGANAPEGTIRYTAKSIGAADEQSLDRLRAALRWFAGDAYVEQPA
ncbi:protein kinase [Nocardiopsis mangrovi]|uniref:Protein kinase n=1 Tax=Nocardiopsis mangrovi TaxID=1179818 RepID=A0ABV9DY83_9ACTN